MQTLWSRYTGWSADLSRMRDAEYRWYRIITLWMTFLHRSERLSRRGYRHETDDVQNIKEKTTE